MTITALPLELRAQIFSNLDFWSLTSFRLACRAFDNAFQEDRPNIVKTQRRNITDLITHWYTSLTDWYLDPEDLQSSPDEGWVVQEPKNEFTLDVMRHMPCWRNSNIVRAELYPGGNAVDWRSVSPSNYEDIESDSDSDVPSCATADAAVREEMRTEEAESSNVVGINIRHCFSLTFTQSYVLDTMHARVYWFRPGRGFQHSMKESGPMPSWQLDDFVRYLLRYPEAMSMVCVPGAVVYVSPTRLEASLSLPQHLKDEFKQICFEDGVFRGVGRGRKHQLRLWWRKIGDLQDNDYVKDQLFYPDAYQGFDKYMLRCATGEVLEASTLADVPH